MTPRSTEPAGKQRTLADAAFLICVAAGLLPVVLFTYLPLADGPAHVYNAKLIAEALSGEASYWDWIVRFNPILAPNWTTHALLALLLFIFDGPVAERIVIGAYAILLPVAFRYYLRSVSRHTHGCEFLIFPFIYSSHLHWGFYNFCYSLALYLIVVGFWLRFREQLTWRRALVLSGLGLLLFFSHPVSLVQTIIATAVISAWDILRRGYRPWAQIGIAAIAFAPAVVLYLQFMARRLHHSSDVTEWPTFNYAAASLITLFPLKSFFDAELVVTKALAGLLAISAVWLLVRLARSRSWFPAVVFLSIAAVQVLLLFISPVTAGGGTMITPRLIYYPVFSVILALVSITWSRAWVRIFAPAGVAACIALHILHWPAYRAYDARMQAVFNAIPQLSSGRTIAFAATAPSVPLTVTGQTPNMSLSMPAYLGVRDRLIYLNNYEAATDHFPLVFRDSASPVGRLFTNDGAMNLSGYERHAGKPVDYILIWGETPAWLRAAADYRESHLAAGAPALRLFEKISAQ